MKSKSEIPDYLYRYTSINNLALILKTRNIRFARLDTVNDLTEGSSSDYGPFSQYLFVSCWTDLIEENLPMWNMYTKDMIGVRIKFKFPIIKTFDDLSIVDINNHIFKDFIIFPDLNPFVEVKYSNSPKKLAPKIMISEFAYSTGKLGIYKAKNWSFESEWRYVVKILPNGIKALNNKVSLDFIHYDFQIDEDSFKSMEITLGPKCDESHRIIVESLMHNYNKNAILSESFYKGRIQ
jgi:hypothetical protein